MRNTAAYAGKSTRYGNTVTSAANDASGDSIPAPIGGWDAINPLAAMPPQNAIDLINWFPQPGYVELRRGHLIWCDTGTSLPVETVMAFMGQAVSTDTLIAASDGALYDVTGNTPTTLGTGYTDNRWQFTNFASTGGSFLWMCNGFDTPQYWDGSSLTVTSITRSDSGNSNDFISVTPYNQRLWLVAKNTTKAFYLGIGAVTGAAAEFDVGNDFLNGGYLQAIGTFSTDTIDGPDEFICFISSQGDVAVYNITDPTESTGISYRGRSEVSQPVGWRCLCKIGADLGIITLDGVLPLSQVLTYDKAALINASITKNIRQAITQAVRVGKDFFGWQLHSYPRNTMAVLNVPVIENTEQDQYVMNTITGAWARFTGQNGSCWEVFQDLLYFGGNDGVVRLADTSGGDENEALTADMRQAFNYFSTRGQLKDFTTIRPNITVDVNFPVQPSIGINVDFGMNAILDPIVFGSDADVATWNDPATLWNFALWAGNVSEANWAGISGVGYCASVRMTCTIPWSESVRASKDLQINGFDILTRPGAFI